MSVVHLNRKLTLEAEVKTADGAGGFTVDWVAQGQIWADVRLRSGRDRTNRIGRVSEADYRIIIRATPVGSASRPVPGQRFAEGARTFLIEAVGDDHRTGNYLSCFAREEMGT